MSSKSRQFVPTGVCGVNLSNPPVVEQIAKQAVKLPDDEVVAAAQRCARLLKTEYAPRSLEHVIEDSPIKIQRAVQLWFSVISLKKMNFTQNKRV